MWTYPPEFLESLAGLGLALALYAILLRQPSGGERAQFIGGLIEKGAMAFLRRQLGKPPMSYARSVRLTPASR